MDVLKPSVIWIGNRCYRRNPMLQREGNFAEEDFTDDITDRVYCDETCDESVDVRETKDGFTVSMDIPSVFFKFIIGKKGETRKNLEAETRTQIRIPKLGQEGEVVILGHDKQGVCSAKTRVDVMVETARQREPFTHFLSLPINSDLVRIKFDDFKDDILRECDGDRGLDRTIFQNPLKLHLTAGTLVLLTKKEIQKAVDVLQQCQQDLVEPILKGEGLHYAVKGLEYMNDDPNAVDVLYAKLISPDEDDRLQILADQLVDKFTSLGLMQHQYDRVKLHVTVMNSLMRKEPTAVERTRHERGTGSGKQRESFDASKILKKFGSYDFGTYHFNTLHLSQRHSSSPDGYYTCAGSIALP
ncbi:activating signal cointegrator 1 complex subunit 1-like [Gigantopelta aegis]|uniref:activating signal cointegrator 1 complex subunit 1-like n=1 Tax=Gigantopelta aegis TaxID=1735272 RepID=UPI001B88A5AC|nr:activating signal cointegrator 1 complex subunit 1-like [Gigantopelta aegis]XP_041350258.1 activating signal cointegrator 1 complex subunit 1-like [Gigantopelta aegis]XP_041350264.1 activating signal cointegrator 1 complex subunit 1-like [Gigantopelta aegis]XP_041350273.1 activating signal cointegrator 1 complex subunit 1-like [Gigantopelta aegis]XP_041350282.1 activating signal cointegrator 1 complex subunit 1-like [Gigantopelta aegis]XP_041350291.1 activating signal cointegrator 1 complex